MIWRLAWRNLWRNRTRSLILVSALTVGYIGLAVITSLSYGLIEAMLTGQVDHGTGHIQIHARDYLRDRDIKKYIPNPEAIIRTIRSIIPGARVLQRVRIRGILASSEGTYPVEVIASPPEDERRHSRLNRYLIRGRWPGEPREILLGQDLARKIRVQPGDRVVLMTADLSGELVSEGFRVAGLFRTPSRDLNRSTAFIRLAAGQKLLNLPGAVHEIVITFPDRRMTETMAERIRQKLSGDLDIQTWKQLQPAMKYMIETFRETNFVTIFFVYLAAIFGVANVFFMAMYERLREFGILRALGVHPTFPGKLILVEGIFLFTLSALFGNGLYFMFYKIFHQKGIDLSVFSQALSLMGSDAIIYPQPAVLDLVIILTVLLGCVTLAVYPVHRRLKKMNPAEAMRHV